MGGYRQEHCNSWITERNDLIYNDYHIGSSQGCGKVINKILLGVKMHEKLSRWQCFFFLLK